MIGLTISAPKVKAISPDASRRMEVEIMNALNAVALVGKNRMMAASPVATGTLRLSWMVRAATKNGRRFTASTFSNEPSADIVESGRRPGAMPPPANMQAWVRRKLNIIGKGRASERDAVAFVISKSIAAKGIRPTHVFSAAFEATKPDADKIMDGAAERIKQILMA